MISVPIEPVDQIYLIFLQESASICHSHLHIVFITISSIFSCFFYYSPYRLFVVQRNTTEYQIIWYPVVTPNIDFSTFIWSILIGWSLFYCNLTIWATPRPLSLCLFFHESYLSRTVFQYWPVKLVKLFLCYSPGCLFPILALKFPCW